MAARQIVYASIHGMLSRLDPHTAFLEPDDFSAMREKQQGSFYGLGIQIQKRMGRITVIAPMEGTPAFKLGHPGGRHHHAHVEDEELKEDSFDRRGRPQAARSQGQPGERSRSGAPASTNRSA